MPANANAIIRFLCTLRTLRRYRDEPVPEAALRAILEAGRWCGSAANRQPWQFVVVRDPATRAQLASLSPYAEFVADAPVCIAVVMDGEETGLSFDAGRVTQNLLLAAHAQDIGSCNAGLPAADQQRAARELLGVPDGHSLGVLVALGYPAPGDRMESPAGPPRRPPAPMLGRKPLAELVHHERFGRRTPTTPATTPDRRPGRRGVQRWPCRDRSASVPPPTARTRASPLANRLAGPRRSAMPRSSSRTTSSRAGSRPGRRSAPPPWPRPPCGSAAPATTTISGTRRSWRRRRQVSTCSAGGGWSSASVRAGTSPSTTNSASRSTRRACAGAAWRRRSGSSRGCGATARSPTPVGTTPSPGWRACPSQPSGRTRRCSSAVAANGCSASPPARRTSSASRRALPGGGLDFAGDIEAALAEKVGWVRAAAEARFARLELAALIWNVAVTDDRWTAAEEVAAARGLTAE